MGRKRVTVSDAGGRYRLLDEGLVAAGFWSRFIGLMGKHALAPGEGLLIYPCSSVHMFWMRMALDVVYVAADHTVIGVDRDLQPWRIGSMHRGVRYVIEVAAQAAKEVQPGDQLVLTGWEPRSLGQRLSAAWRR